MILAAAIDITINLLMVVHVLVSLLMILVVLMQRPKQEGLGAAFGGGVMDSFAGAGTTNFLQKTTVYLGTTFFVLSLALAILIGNRNHQVGPEDIGTPAESVEAAPPVPEFEIPSISGEAEKALEEETTESGEAPAPEAPAPEAPAPEAPAGEGEAPAPEGVPADVPPAGAEDEQPPAEVAPADEDGADAPTDGGDEVR